MSLPLPRRRAEPGDRPKRRPSDLRPPRQRALREQRFGVSWLLLNAYSKYASQEQVLDPGPLLQHYLIAFFEPAEEFGLGAVRNSYVDRNLLLAVFRAGIGDFDRCLFVLVVDNRALGNLEHTLVFFQNDFRVGGHFGLQFTAWIVDGHAYFKSGDVVFFHAHGRDLGDHAIESLVLEGFHLNSRRLSQIDLADVALVNLALHVNLAGISQGHDQGCGRAQYQNRADGIAHFHVTRQDDSVDR